MEVLIVYYSLTAGRDGARFQGFIAGIAPRSARS